MLGNNIFSYGHIYSAAVITAEMNVVYRNLCYEQSELIC